MITIVPFSAAHIEAIAALEQLAFSEPWSISALEEELHNPCAHFLTALNGDAVVGYLGCHHIAGEGYITNIVVDPSYRRQGIGKALLTAALCTKEPLSRITLEVRLSNHAARALYQSLGFTEDGIRPRFYTHPTEDAVIYSYYRR